ncbi:hypothetical protein BV898_12640 [Hypsibius exemplaris]|uniref:Phage tail collar domain-containing protein n=1 Tax=Hypsibius exemplaris TaxID=2072580 RepID=A0A1W0WD31_HYPEX|nr:hypothetical protein BV898_12640 [Hypsibius exemplaris]
MALDCRGTVVLLVFALGSSTAAGADTRGNRGIDPLTFTTVPYKSSRISVYKAPFSDHNRTDHVSYYYAPALLVDPLAVTAAFNDLIARWEPLPIGNQPLPIGKTTSRSDIQPLPIGMVLVQYNGAQEGSHITGPATSYRSLSMSTSLLLICQDEKTCREFVARFQGQPTQMMTDLVIWYQFMGEEDYSDINGQLNLMNTTDCAVKAGQVSSVLPTGFVAMALLNDAPEGWLPCNGTVVDPIRYPGLFALIGGSTPILLAPPSGWINPDQLTASNEIPQPAFQRHRDDIQSVGPLKFFIKT